MKLSLEKLLTEMEPQFEYVDEDSDEIPEPGDVIRTKKMQMEGKVESVGKNRAGYDEVFFRVDDGRLMKTPLSNVTIITKLADCDSPMMESVLNEISNEVLAKYKTAAAADARKSDTKARDDLKSGKKGDFSRGNKRFKGILKATRKQFDNDAKKTNEGMMGGINRVSNPGLKYDKVLDEVKDRWKQEQMEAIDPWHGYTPDDPKAGALAKAPKSAVQGSPGYPLGDMIKDNIKTHGLKWAFNYHVLKHGLPPRQFQLLAGLMPKKISTNPLGEAGPDDLGKQLGQQVKKQAAPVKKTDERPYHGWIVRWELVPKVKGGPHKWVTWHEKSDPKTAKSGESPSAEQAFQDATAYINSGGGRDTKYVQNALVDFNGEFSSEINPEELPFWIKFEDGYLIISYVPQEGFARASKRQQIGESQLFWSAPLKAAEAQAQKLVPNGRYILGEQEKIDDETSMFRIHFQNVVAHQRDRLRMGAPGFTIGTKRETPA